MVLDYQRLKMLEMYRDLISRGYEVCGIATDCFYVGGGDGSIVLNEGVKAWDKLGLYRYDGTGELPRHAYYYVLVVQLRLFPRRAR